MWKSADTETVLSAVTYGKSLESPILGEFYRVPEPPANYVEPTVLDASLQHIPIYAHLKTFDLKPVERPKTPAIFALLRSKYFEDTTSCKSSRTSPSSARTNEGKSVATYKSQEV